MTRRDEIAVWRDIVLVLDRLGDGAEAAMHAALEVRDSLRRERHRAAAHLADLVAAYEDEDRST